MGRRKIEDVPIAQPGWEMKLRPEGLVVMLLLDQIGNDPPLRGKAAIEGGLLSGVDLATRLFLEDAEIAKSAVRALQTMNGGPFTAAVNIDRLVEALRKLMAAPAHERGRVLLGFWKEIRKPEVFDLPTQEIAHLGSFELGVAISMVHPDVADGLRKGFSELYKGAKLEMTSLATAIRLVLY